MIKVKDPKQNKHCWCGILTVASDEKQTTLPDEDFVFLKTSRDAHFVVQGVVVEKRELDDAQTKEAIEKIVGAAPLIDRDGVRNQINEDLKTCIEETANPRILEIIEINKGATDPLPNELSLRTEFLFRDDLWLDRYGERVGAEWIRIGRLLPCLPVK